MPLRRCTMADHTSVGLWVRRFLMEHLVHERGVSRNTQQSYRDTFCLFLPFVATRRKTAVDKLVMEDLPRSPSRSSSCTWNRLEAVPSPPEIRDLPLSMPS